MDYGNYGKYLYNLCTGETVGVKKQAEETKTEDQKTVEHNNGTWNIIGSDLNPNQEYGTVEDLTFEQLCNLFLQGNLEVDEFVKGLQSRTNPSVDDIYKGLDKDIKDINVTKENGTVTVTFQARSWRVSDGVALNSGARYTTYTLTCSVDASESQTDNKTEITISEDAMKMLVSKYGIAENDIPKYFSKVSSENGKSYGSSALASTIYKINNGMTVQELEKHLSENYKSDTNSKFSKTILADAGITQTLLAKYFVENGDGTYSIKPNCTTDDGKPITNLEDIRDTYNTGYKSLDEYINTYCGQYMKTFNISNPSISDITSILDLLGSSNCTIVNDVDYNQYYQVIGKALMANGYLDGDAIKNYKAHQSSGNLEEWSKTDEYKNIIESVKNALCTFSSDIAKELGKTPSRSDVFKHIINMGIDVDLSRVRTKFYNEQVGYPPQGWEDNMKKIIGFGGTMYDVDADTIAFKLQDYINEGEPNSTDCYTIGIIFKAAGIEKTDSIEEKQRKLAELIYKIEESNMYFDGKHYTNPSTGRLKDITAYDLFDYLKANGFIDENTYNQANIDDYNSHIYDDEEFHDVVEDVVLDSFVKTDTSDLTTIRNLDKVPETDTNVTETNYKELEETGVISPKTEEEQKELREEVLEKLIHESQNIQADSGEGWNETYSNNWLKTILKGLGATDVSIRGSYSGSHQMLYSDPGYVHFTLNGHKYELPLAGYDAMLRKYEHNTNWYDTSEVEKMKEKLKKGGFPASSIDKIFKLAKSVDGKPIDGEKCYMISCNANLIIEKLYKDVSINSVGDVINFIENIDSYQRQEATEE